MAPRREVPLRPDGWGLFRTPGEKKRLDRLVRVVDDLFDVGPAAPAPGWTEPGLEAGPPPVVQASGDAGRKWGDRKLFVEGQSGSDVATLQRQLGKFGFLGVDKVSGVFDEETKAAVRKFQHHFGIYVDGVAGSVTVRVINYLQAIGYSADRAPLLPDTNVLIQRVARSQSVGVGLVGTLYTPSAGEATNGDVAHTLSGDLVTRIVAAVNRQPVLQGAEIPRELTQARAVQLADSMTAEFVLYVSVVNDEKATRGVRTLFYDPGDAPSVIGAPLATCVHDEILQLGVADRGCEGENSTILQGPQAPTIRVEFGNLADASDLRRLSHVDHRSQLADAVAAGVYRLYQLDLPAAHAGGRSRS